MARFIATEANASTIQPSPDGKLPELHLHEIGESAEKVRSSGGSNPLLLLGLLCVSVATSVVLMMVDVEDRDVSTLQAKQEARWEIDEKYFADAADPNAPLKPYQKLLRQAQQAHSRGDWTEERRAYRRVLEMLRSEERREGNALTGRRRSPPERPSERSDERLEQLISILLRD